MKKPDRRMIREIQKRRHVPEDAATRAAIAEGIAEARRGEFATDEEVAEVFARFRGRP
jgi:predicted transcriptional regulator